MARGDTWSTDEDNELTYLYNCGIPDREIAEELHRSVHAIGARRSLLGLTNSPHAASARMSPAMFPRFEDVTKAECRAITATTPPSGKFSRTLQSSGMTSCAILMMET